MNIERLGGDRVLRRRSVDAVIRLPQASPLVHRKDHLSPTAHDLEPGVFVVGWSADTCPGFSLIVRAIQAAENSVDGEGSAGDGGQPGDAAEARP